MVVSPLVASIVPLEVFVAEVFGGGCDDAPLFPAEEAVISGAVPKRRREFAAVRACARRALVCAGLEPGPIRSGPSGAPVWPPGVVGSMTHCEGYRACAIGRTEAFSAIGIDAEPHDLLPDGVLPLVASEPERAALAGLAAVAPGLCWERILFSAKESVYKAWFPATGRWLGFTDAELTLDPSGTFAARLLAPGAVVGGRPVPAYHGRWIVGPGLIATAVVVPAVGAAASPPPLPPPPLPPLPPLSRP